MGAVQVLTEQLPGPAELYCHLTLPTTQEPTDHDQEQEQEHTTSPAKKKTTPLTVFVSNVRSQTACPMGSLVYALPTVSLSPNIHTLKPHQHHSY